MFATREQIDDVKKELEEIKKLLLSLHTEKSSFILKEFTLNETAKMLGISTATLREKVERGEIEAIPEPRSNAIKGITYKFTPKMLENYQVSRMSAAIPTIDINKFIEDTINEFQRKKGFM